MTDAKLFNIGEEVLIRGIIVERQFEGAHIKYKVKDVKSAKPLDWYYTDKDIIEMPASIASNVKEGGDNG